MMKLEQKYCPTCKKNKPETTEYFYWDNSKSHFESQCKNCRLIKQKIQKRKKYDPKKERKRHLRRKQKGEFVDSWKKWKEKYPEKYKARYTLRNAVRAGKITKEDCAINNNCSGIIEAHHDDYSKPLEVTWLCRKHHKELHYPAITSPTSDEEK